MAKEKLKKLKEWLQKRGIEIDVHPAITFFGIITVSAGELEIHPEKWSKEEEEKVTAHLQKTANISLEDYQSLLKEAIEKKAEEEIAAEIQNILETFKAEINEIVKSIRENPFLTLEEFKGRTENKAIDYKFVGRGEELEEQNTFWNNPDDKISIIVGEGGTGKTRLALEFAQKLTERGALRSSYRLGMNCRKSLYIPRYNVTINEKG
ncbi:MAG TPA: ATP-binding protein [Desulfobacteria bacterium]|nr:ATP-binding protein [Desulfobacteria bacterium]